VGPLPLTRSGTRTLPDVTSVQIRPQRYGAPVVGTLLAAAMADLAGRYGTGDETPVEPGEFDHPEGGFFVAYLDGRPVGCAGWRSRGEDGGTAELKRMYVAPEARRHGVARELLAAAERDAAGQGRKRMILECGLRQPEAIALYEASGYRRIEDFGHYRGQPMVRSFGRDLEA
jgi:GNAT superfamily N-acetyltransferase